MKMVSFKIFALGIFLFMLHCQKSRGAENIISSSVQAKLNEFEDYLFGNMMADVPTPGARPPPAKIRSVRSPKDDRKETETQLDEDEEDGTANDFDIDPRDEVNEHERQTDSRKKFSAQAEKKPEIGEIRLPENYDLNRIELILDDNGTLNPVPVIHIFTIKSLLEIDELNEEIKIEVDTFASWADGQLYNARQKEESSNTTANETRQVPVPDDYINLKPTFLKRIWTPDIYIDNLLRVGKPSYMSAPVSLLFHQKLGYFRYRSRVVITLKCPMEFHYYPADTQKCKFFFKSYAYFSDQLQLIWGYDGVYFADPSDANFDIQADKVTARKAGEAYADKVRNYDVLEFYILARRKLSYHLIQTYLPSIFFIVITWLTFLLPPSMVEVRIGIAMTTLLTLTAMFSSVRESSPIVSYVKAIDVWMVACIAFVFSTLLEFAVLAWLETTRKKAIADEKERIRKKKRKEIKLRDMNKNGGGGNNNDKDDSSDDEEPIIKPHVYENIGWFIEKYAFLIFSISFAIFTLVYWVWLLLDSEYFSWEVNPKHNIDTSKLTH